MEFFYEYEITSKQLVSISFSYQTKLNYQIK
jgi:hypothetical protein